VGELVCQGERGRYAGVGESHSLPCNTAAPSPWILLVLHGSCQGGGEGHQIGGHWVLTAGEATGGGGGALPRWARVHARVGVGAATG
jgi:hypothetical protein